MRGQNARAQPRICSSAHAWGFTVSRRTDVSGSWRRACALAIVPAITLVGLAAVAVGTAAPAAAEATYWALPNSRGDCTQSSPCKLDDATNRVNAAGGGTLTLLGDANNPFGGVGVDLT